MFSFANECVGRNAASLSLGVGSLCVCVCMCVCVCVQLLGRVFHGWVFGDVPVFEGFPVRHACCCVDVDVAWLYVWRRLIVWWL